MFKFANRVIMSQVELDLMLAKAKVDAIDDLMMRVMAASQVSTVKELPKPQEYLHPAHHVGPMVGEWRG